MEMLHNLTKSYIFTLLLTIFCFSSLFSQIDTIPPEAHCIFGVNHYWRSDNDSIFIGRFVDSTKYTSSQLETLRFSFSEDVTHTFLHYNCDQTLDGVSGIYLWITDEAGNQSSCETFMNVIYQSCEPLCSTRFSSIEFRVTTPNGKAISDITLTRVLPEITCSTTFEAREIIGTYSNGDVIMKKPVSNLNGISTLDIIRINKHILGIESLNNPYKLLAADVDGSGSITTFDMIKLAKIILGKESLSSLKWKFIPAGFSFPNWNDPFDLNYTYITDLFETPVPSAPVKIIAIKSGDVNDSYDPEAN